MAATQTATYMVVYPRVIRVEIAVHTEAGCQEAVLGKPRLHVGRSRNLVPSDDLSHTLLPIGARFARLITRCVWKAGFVSDSALLENVKSGVWIPPTTAGTRRNSGNVAIEEVSFGQIDSQVGIVLLDLFRRLHRCTRSKCNARTTGGLILNRRYEVVAVVLPPINRRRVQRRTRCQCHELLVAGTGQYLTCAK